MLLHCSLLTKTETSCLQLGQSYIFRVQRALRYSKVTCTHVLELLWEDLKYRNRTTQGIMWLLNPANHLLVCLPYLIPLEDFIVFDCLITAKAYLSYFVGQKIRRRHWRVKSFMCGLQWKNIKSIPRPTFSPSPFFISFSC